MIGRILFNLVIAGCGVVDLTLIWYSMKSKSEAGMGWMTRIYFAVMFSWCQVKQRHRGKSVSFRKYVDTITYENVSYSYQYQV